MSGSLQIKREYGDLEEVNQNGVNIRSNLEYPQFTCQEVEYIYKQLPQIWGQTELQNRMPEENSTKLHFRQNVSHDDQSQSHFSVMNYLPTFSMNQSKTMFQSSVSENRQMSLSNVSEAQIQSPPPQEEDVSTPTTSVIKHTSPNSKLFSSAEQNSKKLKCHCEICFKEFGHKSNLFIHMRTHNGERPYKCTQCDKCFTHSGNLAIHMRTHSGEKPYACQICGKMFSHSGNLSTHLRTHSGIKPYKCSICSKEFRHSGNLSIHERIHSGVRPFHCQICGKEFYHSGNLTTHMKKHQNLEAFDGKRKIEAEKEDSKQNNSNFGLDTNSPSQSASQKISLESIKTSE